MKIGVLALQGAFIEHVHKLQALGVEAVEVRLPEHLQGLDGLIIPGGESTTIGKLASQFALLAPLKAFAQHKPVWGTCAGMIFMAKEIGIDQQAILGVMDIEVNRNAFGRQLQSFETELSIQGLDDKPFHAIFIRAPMVTGVKEEVEVLARLADGGIVAVKQNSWLATAFHPELTDDNRLHELFIQMVKEAHQTLPA